MPSKIDQSGAAISKNFKELLKSATKAPKVEARVLRTHGVETHYSIYPKTKDDSPTQVSIVTEALHAKIGFSKGICFATVVIGANVLSMRVMNTANNDGYLLATNWINPAQKTPSYFWGELEFSIHDEPYSRGPKFKHVHEGIGQGLVEDLIAVANIMLKLRETYNNAHMVKRK